ncbi:MAG: hypothetical protein AB1816_21560, partial [Bacillota bacterium]
MSKPRLLLHRAVGALLCSALVGALIVGTLCPPGEEVQASGLDISLQGLTATVVGDVCNLRAGPGTGHR